MVQDYHQIEEYKHLVNEHHVHHSFHRQLLILSAILIAIQFLLVNYFTINWLQYVVKSPVLMFLVGLVLMFMLYFNFKYIRIKHFIEARIVAYIQLFHEDPYYKKNG